jgi:hypothetical protein
VIGIQEHFDVVVMTEGLFIVFRMPPSALLVLADPSIVLAYVGCCSGRWEATQRSVRKTDH